MKFKVKFEKGNFYLMTLILTLCLFTCLVWLVLREYFYFIIYLIFTITIAQGYYFTNYIIEKNYFVIKLGIITIKIKYKKIKKVKIENNLVKIYFNKSKIKIYPKNKEVFVNKLNSKLTRKN